MYVCLSKANINIKYKKPDDKSDQVKKIVGVT